MIDNPAAWIAGYFVIGGIAAGLFSWPGQSGSSVIWVAVLWPLFAAIFVGLLIKGVLS